jgi:hypothetical protein
MKAKETTAKVLAAVRYDTSTYDAWLEGVTWKLQAPNQLAQGAKSGGSQQPA